MDTMFCNCALLCGLKDIYIYIPIIHGCIEGKKRKFTIKYFHPQECYFEWVPTIL